MKADLVEEAKLSEERTQYVQDRLYRMIDYAIGRHDWYEEQRTRFLQIGLAVTAASAALATLLVRLSGGISWLPLLVLGLSVFSLLLTGVVLIYLYNSGIGQSHPYRKIADIRSWYFKYNVPDTLPDQLSESPETGRRQVENVSENLKRFLDRWLEYTDEPKKFIEEDLEQVFILQLLQRYRSQQIKSLSSTLTWGIGFTSLAFAVGIALVFFFPAEANSHGGSNPSPGAAPKSDSTKLSETRTLLNNSAVYKMTTTGRRIVVQT